MLLSLTTPPPLPPLYLRATLVMAMSLTPQVVQQVAVRGSGGANKPSLPLFLGILFYFFLSEGLLNMSGM
jgi:hypothetical protein